MCNTRVARPNPRIWLLKTLVSIQPNVAKKISWPGDHIFDSTYDKPAFNIENGLKLPFINIGYNICNLFLFLFRLPKVL